MRSRVIPAQITTVEDKIAGNLSLTQIILILVPVLFVSFMYALLPPVMIFVWYKIILSSIFSICMITLAIRIKGKIIANWLIVLARYNLRPKYFIYNKNSMANRVYVKSEIKKKKLVNQKVKDKNNNQVHNSNISEILQFNHILDSSNLNLIYRANRKGGLNVAFEKLSK